MAELEGGQKQAQKQLFTCRKLRHLRLPLIDSEKLLVVSEKLLAVHK